MFEFIDFVIRNRRIVIGSVSITINLLVICLLAPVVQAYHSNISARIQSTNNSQSSLSPYDSSNAVTGAFAQMADDTQHVGNAIETKTLSGVMSVTASVTNFDKATLHGAEDTVGFTGHVAFRSVVDTGQIVGDSVMSVAHAIGDGFGLFHVLAHIRAPHIGLPHLGSIIDPKDTTPIPVITQLQIQQANLIESGTKDVVIAATTTGVGGACDNGSGNGGYPITWCNAPMDTYSTLPFNNDRINRECTSYAYWFFTSVEGHTNFQASGNAKFWATTSNYPIHATPAVGAIAVETAGAYGHVAIVQALPGQSYAGQVVPAGYVLVSEMNYDWHGHFRYSYSPLSKFSAYIYQ